MVEKVMGCPPIRFVNHTGKLYGQLLGSNNGKTRRKLRRFITPELAHYPGRPPNIA
jgi:hypothetical protein